LSFTLRLWNSRLVKINKGVCWAQPRYLQAWPGWVALTGQDLGLKVVMGSGSKIFVLGGLDNFYVAQDGSATSGSEKFPPKIPNFSIFFFQIKINLIVSYKGPSLPKSQRTLLTIEFLRQKVQSWPTHPPKTLQRKLYFANQGVNYFGLASSQTWSQCSGPATTSQTSCLSQLLEISSKQSKVRDKSLEVITLVNKYFVALFVVLLMDLFILVYC